MSSPLWNFPNSKLAEDAGAQAGRPTGMWQNWFAKVNKLVFGLSESGTTAQRPVNDLYIGRMYFDTTLDAPVWVEQVTPTVIWTTCCTGGGGGSASFPAGGTTGQVLGKASGADDDVAWINDQTGLPVGGTTGQVLGKASGATNDVAWINDQTGLSGLTEGQVVIGAADGAAAQAAQVSYADSGEADGTFKLTVPNWLQLDGAADTDDAYGMYIGTADKTGALYPSAVVITAGGAVDGYGAYIQAQAGASSGAGNGGAIQLNAGNAGGAGDAGNVEIYAGVNLSTGKGGDVLIAPGGSSAGTPGKVKIGTQVSYGDSAFSDNTFRLTSPNWFSLDASVDADLYGWHITTLDATGRASNVLNINTGATDTDYSGFIALATGQGTSAADSGGVDLFSGNALGSGNTGQIVLQVGHAAEGNGGKVRIQAGDSLGAGAGGNVEITAGASVSGTAGHIELTAGISDSGVPGHILLDAPHLEILHMAQTGSGTATFSAANAPAAVTPQAWLKVLLGGVAGWVPWFSTLPPGAGAFSSGFDEGFE